MESLQCHSSLNLILMSKQDLVQDQI
jgi:hypothetical protein